MKKLFLLLLLSTTITSFSQDPFLQKTNSNAEKEAFEITNRYISELALTGKQQLLFQQKVEEFLIRRYKIEAEFEGKEKLDLLYQLQKQETNEMNDIITRPQMTVYRNVKSKIQPLDTLEKDK